jgi:glutamate-ammonia-ligase adenylyltransferase
VQEICYARPLTAGETESIRAMRHRIETERGDPRHPELEFKTGTGGLVDVEFLIQALQLRHGHSHRQLRTAHTLAALNRLTAQGLVEEEPASQLRHHYLFLRRIESALRRVENTTVSRLPVDARAQTLLATRLGLPDATEFLATYQHATRQLRALYDELMPRD